MEHRICILLICLSYIPTILPQKYRENTITKDEHPDFDHDDISDTNPFADVASNAAEFLQSNAMGDIGDMVSGFLQSGGGKAVENVLMGAMQNPDTASQILSGIGSLMNNNNAGAALDPSLMVNMLSLMASTANTEKPKQKQRSQEQLAPNVLGLLASMMAQQQISKDSDTMDLLGTVVNTVSNAFADSGENPMSLIMSSINSFMGPEADRRESEHASHAYLLPPLLEKAHVYFDHFKHTDLYKSLWKVTGADKIFQMFAMDGKFNFTKFFDRLENKGFRKHWIHVITKKITDIIAFVTDSSRFEKYTHTIVPLFNGFLKSSNFPKSTLFDPSRPEDTLTKFFNYILKKYLSMDINSSQYVVPAVAYVKDILHLAHTKGFFVRDGLNSNELAKKLTDTINLEMIEPILRVWRAYRFAKKHPECDKYVMCLINQDNPEDKVSLPGLKMGLSKAASMYASWFLSSKTGTSFWTLYGTIHDESDCSIRFVETCNNFHIEETNIESEYTHTEL